MPNYAANNTLGGTQQNLSSGFKSQVILTAPATPKRIKVYSIMVGVNGTPADNELEWDVSRQTAAGTATSITPNTLDPADGAAVTVAAANATAEGTVTANSSVWYVPINQRASYLWQVNLGSGQELTGPATNLAGFALRVKSAGYTGTVGAHMWFNE